MRRGGWPRLSDHCGLRLCQCWAFRVPDWPGCGRWRIADARELIHAVLRDSGGASSLNSCITIAGGDDPLAQHLLGPSVVM